MIVVTHPKAGPLTGRHPERVSRPARFPDGINQAAAGFFCAPESRGLQPARFHRATPGALSLAAMVCGATPLTAPTSARRSSGMGRLPLARGS